MITVTVCVGSSCHIKGAREMIGCFNEFLTREIMTSSSAEDGARMFQKRVLEELNRERHGQAGKEPNQG